MSTINTNNFILKTDSYKISHFLQYQPGTQSLFSYGEARGGLFEKAVVMGLQKYVKKYLTIKITTQDIIEAQAVARLHGFNQFNVKMWEHVVKNCNGYVPVVVRGVPEGSVVPVKNMIVSVEIDDPEKNGICFPLVSHIETTLLREIWYATTVASLSYKMKEIIRSYMVETVDDDKIEAILQFMLQDFGMRGVSSEESAEMGGLGHLANFNGTDTIDALMCAAKYYNVDLTDPEQMIGFSIPASEHSTMTSWGKDREVEAMENMLDQFGNETLVACVSDSYDIYNACSNLWGEQLRQKAIDMNATLVVRPDSGYPPDVVVDCLNRLGEKFGYERNSKGFKVLKHVKVIQGDGIDLQMLPLVLEAMTIHEWATENVTFGSGGGLLQKVDRDTMKFAFKCSSTLVNGVWFDVFKDPITDKGKTSKKGRLRLVTNDNNIYHTIREEDAIPAGFRDAMVTFYKSGDVLVDEHFFDIRARARAV